MSPFFRVSIYGATGGWPLVSDLMVIKPAYLVIDMGSNDLGRQHALQSVDNIALELVMKVLQAIEMAQIPPPRVIFLEQLKRARTHSSWVVGTRQYNRQMERFNIEVNRAAKQRYCPLSSVRGVCPSFVTADALQQAVSYILGSTDNAGQCVRSIANSSGIDLPLGATLPQRISSKIVSGEYVELSQILYPGGDDISLRVCIGEDGTKALNLDPPKARSIAIIEMWTSVMLVYASVYLPAHPSEIADFLHYIIS